MVEKLRFSSTSRITWAGLGAGAGAGAGAGDGLGAGEGDGVGVGAGSGAGSGAGAGVEGDSAAGDVDPRGALVVGLDPQPARTRHKRHKRIHTIAGFTAIS